MRNIQGLSRLVFPLMGVVTQNPLPETSKHAGRLGATGWDDTLAWHDKSQVQTNVAMTNVEMAHAAIAAGTETRAAVADAAAAEVPSEAAMANASGTGPNAKAPATAADCSEAAPRPPWPPPPPAASAETGAARVRASAATTGKTILCIIVLPVPFRRASIFAEGTQLHLGEFELGSKWCIATLSRIWAITAQKGHWRRAVLFANAPAATGMDVYRGVV